MRGGSFREQCGSAFKFTFEFNTPAGMRQLSDGGANCPNGVVSALRARTGFAVGCGGGGGPTGTGLGVARGTGKVDVSVLRGCSKKV